MAKDKNHNDEESTDKVDEVPPAAAGGPPHAHDQSTAAYSRDRNEDGSPRGVDLE